MKRPRILHLALAMGIVGCLAAAAYTLRKVHTGYFTASSLSYFRFFLDRYGDGADAKPAEDVFEQGYLSLVFGDDPQLLRSVNRMIGAEDGAVANLQMQRVAALLLTYQYDQNDEVEQLALRMFGDRSLARKPTGFHRHGYFRNAVDDDLWHTGNTVLELLGRDIDLKTAAPYKPFQDKLTESLFTGELLYVLHALKEPHYFVLAIPAPRGLLPPELRAYVKSVVVKGRFDSVSGRIQTKLYCGTPRQARYTSALLADMKYSAESLLRGRFGGTIEQKAWGPQVGSWWAHEMAMTSEETLLKQEENVVTMEVNFGRTMLNASLKSFERMGRDLQMMRKQFDLKLDPRIADAQVQVRQPRHYWTEHHRWGPNWPVPPGGNEAYEALLERMSGGSNVVMKVEVQPDAEGLIAGVTEPASVGP